MEKDKPGDIIEKRRQKVEDLLQADVELFPNDYKVRDTILEIKSAIENGAVAAGKEPIEFCVAGRMMAINRFGKTAFVRFRDRTGQLQAYIRKDQVGEHSYSVFQQLDIGDFIGVKGSVFQTRTGEWTLLAREVRLLSKAIRPLPEKFHGLKDPEKRYRQRYIDLIMNPQVRDIFIKRSQIIQTIRAFLLEREFIEVETPMMQTLPGGAEATPFKTHHNALGMDLFLRIAPELYLKRLVVGGFERVFEINRSFRNEGISTQHNPEFTMLEFYQAYADFEDMMDLTEEMLPVVARLVTGSDSIEYQGRRIELGQEWQRMDLTTALQTLGGIDPGLLKTKNKEGLRAVARERGIHISKGGRFGKIIAKLFDALVEPQLIRPTFITGYPVEISPLSRRNTEKQDLTDRFELFIAGREIANGFSELNDPDEQKERFRQQMEDRAAGDEEAHCMDLDYIEALEYGMPPTAGEGIGIDRLVMLLTDSASIREVIFFPHMKPLAKDGSNE